MKISFYKRISGVYKVYSLLALIVSINFLKINNEKLSRQFRPSIWFEE